MSSHFSLRLAEEARAGCTARATTFEPPSTGAVLPSERQPRGRRASGTKPPPTLGWFRSTAAGSLLPPGSLLLQTGRRKLRADPSWPAALAAGISPFGADPGGGPDASGDQFATGSRFAGRGPGAVAGRRPRAARRSASRSYASCRGSRDTPDHPGQRTSVRHAPPPNTRPTVDQA